MSIEQIKKINKTIVREDGRIDSLEKQLINLISGLYDTRFPMIVSENSRCLDFISKNSSNPLVINVSTVIKIREKHDIGYAFVSECEEMIKNSIFAFDSLNKSTSKILVLNKKDEENNPIIAVIRFNKEMGRNAIKINEITSIYDKQRLSNLIIRSYDAGKMFYKNKIEQLREEIEYEHLENYKNHRKLLDIEKLMKEQDYNSAINLKNKIRTILNRKELDVSKTY